MACGQFSTFYSCPIASGRLRKVKSIALPDSHRGFVAMRARNGSGRTVKQFVIGLADRVTIEHLSDRLLRTSHLRRRTRRRPALWSNGTYVATALVRAWSVTTAAVVLLSAMVSVAPMWDRAIFMKSLLEALNTNPALMQGL